MLLLVVDMRGQVLGDVLQAEDGLTTVGVGAEEWRAGQQGQGGQQLAQVWEGARGMTEKTWYHHHITDTTVSPADPQLLTDAYVVLVTFSYFP